MSSEISNNDIIILKELIAKVFRSYNLNKNHNKISKKTIQKILYKVNRKLPIQSELKNTIPYYWYLAGPYSERVDQVIQIMKSEQILIPDNGIYELYKFNSDLLHKRFTDNINSDLHNAREIISQEINEMTGFGNLHLVKELYDDAPLLFYPSYKTQFLVYFESFCNYFLEENNTSKNLFGEHELLESLQKTKISLSNHSIFDSFNKLYQNFIVIVTHVLSYNKKTNSDFISVLPSLKNIANKIWTTYAYGARIVEHDKFYDSRIPKWENMFLEQITQLEDNMKKTQAMIVDTLQITIEKISEIEDHEFKLHLAKSVGFDTIPDYDSKAFERLTGVIASKINTEDFDAVELVRETRGD